MRKSIEFYAIAVIIGLNFFLFRRIDSFFQISLGGIQFKAVTLISVIFFVFVFFKKVASRRSNKRIWVGIPLYSLLFFIIIGSISAWLNGVNEIKSTSASLAFVIPLLFAYVIPEIPLKDKEISILLKVLMFCGVIISVIVITGSFDPGFYKNILSVGSIGAKADKAADFERIDLSFGSANAIGLVLLTLFPLFHLRFLQKNNSPVQNLGYIISIISISSALLITLNRGSTYLLALYIILSLKYSFKLNKVRSYLILVCVILVGFGLISSFDFSRLDEASSPLRLLCWRSTIAMAVDHPLFGIAPNSFFDREALEDVVHTKRTSRDSDSDLKWYNNSTVSLLDPHSQFLLILAEYGILGFLLVTLMFWRIFKILYAVVSDKAEHKRHDLLVVLIIGIILFGMLCTMNSFLSFNSRIAIFFWILVGLALNLAKNSKKDIRLTSTYVSH